MTIPFTVTSKLRLLPALLLCVLFTPVLRAEVSPARLLLLRGAIALGEGQAARAAADLGDAAAMYPEDWRCNLLYGQALLQAGQRERAKAQLRRATLLAPLHPEPWQALARAARETRDEHLEIAAIAGLQRLAPEDPQLLRRLAEIHRGAGRAADADRLDAQWKDTLPPLRLNYRFVVGDHDADLRELRKLAREDPENRAVRYALATEEWRAGNLPAAREVLRALHAAAPANPELVSAYAHLCLLTGEVDAGLDALRGGGQGTVATDRALALWSLSMGRYRDALEPLDRLLQRNAIDANANRLLGFAQMMTGNTGAACTAFRIAWLREHDHLSAQHYASALQADGQVELAENILKRALELSPAESALELQLSLLYRDTDRLARSAEFTAALARSRPEKVELYLLAGERFFRAGYLQRAHQMAAMLRDNFPQDRVAMLGAAALYHRLAARDEARLTLTRYLGPSFPAPMPVADILLLVAWYSVVDNNLTGTVMALEEALKTAPDRREAYLRLGKLHQQQSNWNEATRAYQRALERWPDDPEFTLALARVAWQAGNYPRAMALYRQAAAMLPDAEPLLELGTLYHHQGDETRARECWQAALARPGGQIRGRQSLLVSYERNGEDDRVPALREELRELLANERTARAAHWRGLIAAARLTAADEEIDALLLLEPDLTDPAAV
jgi:predicted Zn-dependent protease